VRLYRVYVHRYKDCKNLVLRYTDPVTGKIMRSTVYRDPETGTETPTGNDRKHAKRLAILWERDLNEGRAGGRCATTWAEFRQRYEDEVVPSLAERTSGKVGTTFNAVERILPRVKKGKVADLDAEALSRFQAALRDGVRSETTIAGYMSHLKAILGWAVEQGIIREVPKIKRPKRARTGTKGKGKGRAITGEEFDRMLAAVPSALAGWNKLQRDSRWRANRRAGKAIHNMKTDLIPVEVAPTAVASWQFYLTGLWLSGLRLTESLELYWDRQDRLCIELKTRRPMLRISADWEKGNRDRLLPITPDFAKFLLATAEADRHGPVFRPLLPSGSRADGAKAGVMVGLIGQIAGVKVHTHPKTGKVKFASAHDLRRSFGTRWARKVTTAVLQKLMRHESISTTMGYYVDLDADELAEDLYEKYGQDNTTPPKSIGIVSGIVDPGGPVTPGQETTQPFTE